MGKSQFAYLQTAPKQTLLKYLRKETSLLIEDGVKIQGESKLSFSGKLKDGRRIIVFFTGATPNGIESVHVWG